MLGVDDHIEPDLTAQDRRIAEVFRIAHAGDRVLCAKLFRHQAADEVHLIVFRNGDEKIRLAHARLQQNADGRAVAVDAHDIQRAVGTAQVGDLVVHKGDVVPFLCQLLGDGIAHLAAAYNNDLHVSSSPPHGAAVFFTSVRAAENSAPKIKTCPDIYSHSSTTITVAMEPYSTEYCPTCST